MRLLASDYKRTLKLVVLFCILLLSSWIISSLIVNSTPIAVILTLIGVILFIVIFFNPLVGLMLLFFVIPFDDVADIPVSLAKIISLVFLISWGARKVITKKNISFPYNYPQGRYLIFLMFALIFSLFFSIDKSASLLFFQRFVLLLALCVFLTDSIRTPKHLENLAWVIGVSGALASFVGLMQYYIFNTGILEASQSLGLMGGSKDIRAEEGIRIAGFAGNPNEFAINLVVSICFLLYCFSMTKNLVLKLIIIILIGCSTVSIVFSLSRSGLVALGVATVIYCVRLRGFKFTAIASVFIIGLAMMTILKFSPDFVYDRLVNLTFFEKDESRANRVIVVKSGLSTFFEKPHTLITGVGLANFPEVAWKRRDAHNMYVQMLVETGLIGFTFFFLLIYRSYRDLWQGVKLRREELQLFCLASLAAFTAILVHGLSGTDTYVKYLWLFFILVPIIRKIKMRSHAPT